MPHDACEIGCRSPASGAQRNRAPDLEATAKAASDSYCVSVSQPYDRTADEVEHNVVGLPSGPPMVRATPGSSTNSSSETSAPRRWDPRTADFCVMEHQWRGTVPGTFLGFPGHGRRITLRLLHIWEFRTGRMRRENVWLDGDRIAARRAPLIAATGERRDSPCCGATASRRPQRGRRWNGR